MEGECTGDNIRKRYSVDGGDYSGGHRKFWNGCDYRCESGAGRRNVKFTDVYDYGFQCNRYDDFANCDCGSVGEFHNRDGDGWRSFSWDGDIYCEWITDWCKRVI